MIEQMNCRVIYDLTASFWEDYRVEAWATLGLVGTSVPTVLIVIARWFPRLSRRPLGKTGQILFACGALVAATVSLTSLAISYGEFSMLRSAYIHGHFALLTGNIENFRNETEHPVVPGAFTVRGHTFIWDPFNETQAFSAKVAMNPPRLLFLAGAAFECIA